MVVAKNNNESYSYSSYGNTAYDYKRYNNITEKENNKAIDKRQERKAQFKKQFKLVGTVAILLCAGMLIVGRYVYVMNLSSQCTQYKTMIADNQKKNDELKIQLMGHDDIKEIEKIATTQLSMVRPDSDNIVHLTINKADNSKKIADAGNTQKSKEGLIDKIMGFFN